MATKENAVALLKADHRKVEELFESFKKARSEDRKVVLPSLAGLGLLEFEEPRAFTYPARLPSAQLDHVYARGLTPVGLHVPRGRVWWRMSDHLPLIAEFRL